MIEGGRAARSGGDRAARPTFVRELSSSYHRAIRVRQVMCRCVRPLAARGAGGAWIPPAPAPCCGRAGGPGPSLRHQHPSHSSSLMLCRRTQSSSRKRSLRSRCTALSQFRTDLRPSTKTMRFIAPPLSYRCKSGTGDPVRPPRAPIAIGETHRPLLLCTNLPIPTQTVNPVRTSVV